jgi:hypothetical protein
MGELDVGIGAVPAGRAVVAVAPLSRWSGGESSVDGPFDR